MQNFLESSCKTTFKGMGVEFTPMAAGAKLTISGISGFVGEYQLSIKADTFDHWLGLLLGDEVDLTPSNLGYFHEFDTEVVLVEKTKKGYHSEVLSGEKIEFYHDGETFERVRGAAIAHLNSFVSLEPGEIDVHRLTTHPVNKLIYDHNPLTVRALRLSLRTRGLLQAIRVNPRGEILLGNSRWKAAFYDNDGRINPILPTLRAEVSIQSRKEESALIAEGNTYRRERTNLELAAEIKAVFESHGRKALLESAREMGLNIALKYALVLLGEPVKKYETVKRVLRIERWTEEYPEEVKNKLRGLINHSPAVAENLMSFQRKDPDNVPVDGVFRVAEVMLAKEAKTLEVGIEIYNKEVAIEDTAAKPFPKAEKTPKPMPTSSVADYPAPPQSSPATEVPQVTQSSPVTREWSPEPTTSNGKTETTQTLEAAVKEIFPAEENLAEGNGAEAPKPPKATAPIRHNWQPPSTVLEVLEALKVIEKRDWQLITGKTEVMNLEKSAFFYYPNIGEKDLVSLLSSKVANFLDEGAETSAVVVLPATALFQSESQPLIVSLCEKFNGLNGRNSSPIVFWRSPMESVSYGTGEIKAQTYAILLPLGNPSLIDAIDKAGKQAIFMEVV